MNTIKSFRRFLGLTQPEMAQKLKISLSTYRRYENYPEGTQGYRLEEFLKRVTEIFNIRGLTLVEHRIMSTALFQPFESTEFNE
jgi:transcriptional regulator with XRE-family HTH domain